MSERSGVVVSGGFDDLRSDHLRFLEEAAQVGDLTVLLWPDELIYRHTGQPPKFPFAERHYVLNAIRYVSTVVPLPAGTDANTLPSVLDVKPKVWVDWEREANAARHAFCQREGLQYRILSSAQLAGFPVPAPAPANAGKTVIVTGCYDWFHSGHVRFFEEVSAFGTLYVVVGHDANIRLLKGEGHPLLGQEERRYMVGSVRYVTEALISTGNGWLDAEPEIQRIRPDIYAVNEEGDRGGKREYCQKMGIEYLVLKRRPAPGLPGRSSTDLRGF